jgi:hypothetical protein
MVGISDRDKLCGLSPRANYTNRRDRDSCRKYFRKIKLLPIQSQYIYLLLIFVINNRQHFKINYIHNINSRNDLDLHCPQPHLSVYQKCAHYTGIKVFNRLPVPNKAIVP